MKKGILFLVLALGVFRSAQAQENPTLEETQKVDLTKKICEAYEAGRFEETIKLGNEFIQISPNSPNLPSAYLLIARSQYNLEKWTEAIDAYRKAQATSTDNEIKEEASKFILEATTAIAKATSKSALEQNNTVSTTLIGLTEEQLVQKYGRPESVFKGRVKREKCIVGLGLSEVLRNPEFVYDNVFKFKRNTDSRNGGYILITCGLLNGKTVFIEYQNRDNSFYKGEAGFFDQDAICLLVGKNLNAPKLLSITSIKSTEDSRFEYLLEENSNAVVVAQNASGSTPWIAIFTEEGWQAYRNFKMEYNSSGLKNL